MGSATVFYPDLAPVYFLRRVNGLSWSFANWLIYRIILHQGNFEEVAIFLVQSGADPNEVYTDDKGKEHNLLFDSVTLGNEVS